MRQPHHAADDGGAGVDTGSGLVAFHAFHRIARQVAGETAVELDGADRQGVQAHQVGVPHAVVVEGHPYAQLVEFPEGARRLTVGGHQGRLGEFEFQHPGVESGLCQDARDLGGEPGVLELPPGDVDAHQYPRRPVEGRPGGLFEHPQPDVPDHARHLGQRNELVGPDVPVLGVGPAQQRLEAPDAARAPDQRLVHQMQLPLVEGRLERAPQDGGAQAPAARLLRVQAVDLTFLTGRVHGGVGLIEQRRGVGGQVGIEAPADAGL